MLTAKNSGLIIIDVQERLVPVLGNGTIMADRCTVLLKAASLLAVPAMITEQYPEGLGSTLASLSDVAENIPVFTKNAFSALAEAPILDHIKKQPPGLSALVIAGCEAHVCVQQTAMDAIDSRYSVCVVWDATASRFESDRELARGRLQRHGADIVSVEMVLFEWLRTSKHPDFRSVSSLIRDRTE